MRLPKGETKAAFVEPMLLLPTSELPEGPSWPSTLKGHLKTVLPLLVKGAQLDGFCCE